MDSLKTTILLLSILTTGLTAGLCFTWHNAVTPGIGRLSDSEYLASFQAMNRAIINPAFAIVFFSPVILLLINVFTAQPKSLDFGLYLIAAVIFIGGVSWVTGFRNVPLNEMIDATPIAESTPEKLLELRKAFEEPWNNWHLVRTISATVSFVILLIINLFLK